MPSQVKLTNYFPRMDMNNPVHKAQMEYNIGKETLGAAVKRAAEDQASVEKRRKLIETYYARQNRDKVGDKDDEGDNDDDTEVNDDEFDDDDDDDEGGVRTGV